MRCIAVSPTYQEAAGIETFIVRFETCRDDFELVIVDDASPDGTGDIVRRLAADRPWLHLLSRTGRDGLGGAYRTGFAWALEHGYDLIAQLDADGQHPPEALAGLRERLLAEEADVVIGSRYVEGGDTGDWPAYRRAMSHVAGVATRRATGLEHRDLSGGFKLWRASALRTIDVASTTVAGYGFQIETTMRAHRAGLKILEVPIAFGVRTQGESKLSGGVVVEGARLLVRLRRDPWSPEDPGSGSP